MHEIEKDLMKKLNKSDIKFKTENYSPLNLAYMGDCVFELLVRTYVLGGGNKPVNVLNKQSSSLVKASSQSEMYHKIEPFLTEKELSVMKRGRNAKSQTHAKNASINDYRHSTGFEALLGYLYFEGETARLIELFDLCIKK